MPTESLSSVDSDLYFSASSRFIAGWYQSITGENRMNDIDECWNDDVSEHLSIALNEAIAAYEYGNIARGDKIMSDSKNLWDIGLAGCGDITVKISEISKKFKDLH